MPFPLCRNGVFWWHLKRCFIRRWRMLEVQRHGGGGLRACYLPRSLPYSPGISKAKTGIAAPALRQETSRVPGHIWSRSAQTDGLGAHGSSRRTAAAQGVRCQVSRGASSKPEILHLQITDSSVAKLSRKYFARRFLPPSCLQASMATRIAPMDTILTPLSVAKSCQFQNW